MIAFYKIHLDLKSDASSAAGLLSLLSDNKNNNNTAQTGPNLAVPAFWMAMFTPCLWRGQVRTELSCLACQTDPTASRPWRAFNIGALRWLNACQIASRVPLAG